MEHAKDAAYVVKKQVDKPMGLISQITTPSINVELNNDFSLKILFSSDFGVKDLDILETLSTGVFGRIRLVKSLSDKKYYTLKIMKKGRIVKNRQMEHVQNELKIMSRLRCPFACDLKAVFQDESCLYLLYDYQSGGELFTHLRKVVRFDLKSYQFYAMEIACALNYLHSKSIVYRDLKPENVCINRDGHAVLTEFSFAKIIETRTYTVLGTPEYAAPEMIMVGQKGNRDATSTSKGSTAAGGYGTTVDWWSLGVLVYEMCMGYPPFFGDNPFMIYKKILERKYDFKHPAPLHPEHSHPDTGSIIPWDTQKFVNELLNGDRLKRLGCRRKGFKDVKAHGFFKGILDWNLGFHQLVVPPMVPTVVHEGDTSNFDYYEEDLGDDPVSLSLSERKMFEAIDELLERPKKVT